jgi:hypothetical protein
MSKLVNDIGVKEFTILYQGSGVLVNIRVLNKVKQSTKVLELLRDQCSGNEIALIAVKIFNSHCRLRTQSLSCLTLVENNRVNKV